MQLRFCFLLLIFLASNNDLAAQYYSIQGTIISEKERPIVGASVFIRDSQLATITDDKGFFKLDSLDAGENALVITHIGYKRIIEYFDVQGNLKLSYEMESFSYDLDAIMITTNRVEDEPFPFSVVISEEIENINLGQDIPFLVQQAPSVVATSDAGTGIGYTGLRIRGSDPTRVNVTINGVPINDSESQSVFWVNMPDFASNVQDIQIQRGVGTSTSGSGAFGGTVAINSHKIYQRNYLELNSGLGSFNTQKLNLKLGTGLLNNTFFIDGRASLIKSDGFIDRSQSNLNSYYFSVGRISDNSTLRLDFFSGQEKTNQAWNGVPEAKYNNDQEGLITHYNNNLGSTYFNRTTPIDLYGTSGDLYFSVPVSDSLNLFGSAANQYNYYNFEEQVDNYQQDHYQLHWGTTKDDYFESNLSIHYTRGRGYFEQFKLEEDLEDYQIVARDSTNNEVITHASLARRRWLANHFFGGILNLKWMLPNGLNVHSGTALHRYIGEHYGNVVAWDIPSKLENENRYYNNDGKKFDGSSFLKFDYELKNLSLYADLQYRFVNYVILGKDNDGLAHDLVDNLHFINPKFGLSYQMNKQNQLYASLAVGNREPDRNDYLSVPAGEVPKSEQLFDYELGLRSKYNKIAGGINFYYMDYKDQLVLTGELNDVGANLRTNVDRSYRAGVEIELGWAPSTKVDIYANTSLSQNKIESYDEIVADYTNGFEIIKNRFEDTDIAFSPNIVGALGLNYKPIEGLVLGLQSKYVGQQFLDNTSNPSRNLDAYSTTSILASYELKFKFFEHVRLNLQLNNVLNQRYASNGYTYNYIDGGLITENFLYPQAGFHFLMGLSLRI